MFVWGDVRACEAQARWVSRSTLLLLPQDYAPSGTMEVAAANGSVSSTLATSGAPKPKKDAPRKCRVSLVNIKPRTFLSVAPPLVDHQHHHSLHRASRSNGARSVHNAVLSSFLCGYKVLGASLLGNHDPKLKQSSWVPQPKQRQCV